MNDIIPFTYEDTPIRVLDRNGEPWFVAADIAASLRYASAKDFVRGLDDEDKGRHIVPTPSGDQEMTIISEGGLYTVLVRARTERVKPFRRWVTHEVLPAIRKTGAYATPEAPEEALAARSSARRISSETRSRRACAMASSCAASGARRSVSMCQYAERDTPAASYTSAWVSPRAPRSALISAAMARVSGVISERAPMPITLEHSVF